MDRRRWVLLGSIALGFGGSLALATVLAVLMTRMKLVPIMNDYWQWSILLTIYYSVTMVYGWLTAWKGGKASMLVLELMMLADVLHAIAMMLMVLPFRTAMLEEIREEWIDSYQTVQLDMIQRKNRCCGFWDRDDYSSGNCTAGLRGCGATLDLILERNLGWVYATAIAIIGANIAGMISAADHSTQRKEMTGTAETIKYHQYQ